MKVIVSEIPRTGLSLDESRPAAELDLEGQGIRFSRPVTMHAEVQRLDAGVEVKLTVESVLVYTCDRCLQPLEQPLSRQLHIVRPLSGEKVIDITQLAREEIVLAYPTKRLCRPECNGLCPHCGRNLNNLSCSCARGAAENPFRGVWMEDTQETEE
jgi:uncharacterized protein